MIPKSVRMPTDYNEDPSARRNRPDDADQLAELSWRNLYVLARAEKLNPLAIKSSASEEFLTSVAKYL